MAGRLADSENLMIDIRASFNRRGGKSQGCEALMGCMQVINHEVERSIARNDFVFKHQYQVRAAAHFIDGHPGSVEYGTHADRAHEPSRFLHAVCIQDYVRHAHRRALIVLDHFLGAQRAPITRASKRPFAGVGSRIGWLSGNRLNLAGEFTEGQLFELDFSACVVDVDANEVAIAVVIEHHALRNLPTLDTRSLGEINT